MAIMHPSSISANSKPYSEVKFYEACRDQLNDKYHVFYSLRWYTTHDGLREDSECDFLIFNPDYGFLCVEVKGGTGITVDGNLWHLDDHDGGRVLKESPYKQSEKSMRYFKGYYEEELEMRFPGIYGCAVAFPNYMVLSPITPESPLEITMDIRSLDNLQKRVVEIFRYFRGRHIGATSFFAPDSQKKFIDLINKRIALSICAGALIQDKERELLEINHIDIVKIVREDESICAVGWLAKTNYLGSIYDKSMKGIRLRKGNILVGDYQTLNVVFKDARFNGWSIGEFYAIDKQLIPNARRDNFEKNTAYFTLFEQLSHLSAKIAKDIRTASLKRNAELSSAMEQIDKASQAATEAIGTGVTAVKKGAITQKLKNAQNAIATSSPNDDIGEYYQGIAFEELDMIIGKLKGATTYKALNSISSLTNVEKKILERVFNTILGSGAENANMIIDSILQEFSPQ